MVKREICGKRRICQVVKKEKEVTKKQRKGKKPGDDMTTNGKIISYVGSVGPTWQKVPRDIEDFSYTTTTTT